MLSENSIQMEEEILLPRKGNKETAALLDWEAVCLGYFCLHGVILFGVCVWFGGGVFGGFIVVVFLLCFLFVCLLFLSSSSSRLKQ